MKWFILCLLSLLCVGFVNAKINSNLLEKPLINIDDCYNLTITAIQTDGIDSGISFNGCNYINNNTWFCDCRTDDNTFELVMQSDKNVLRDERIYKVNITAKVYDWQKLNGKFTIVDWGDYADVKNEHIDEPKDYIVEVEVPIYVNRTVYVDKIVTRPYEVIKNVSWENTTKIDNCIATLDTNTKEDAILINKLSKENKNYITSTIIIGFGFLIAASYLFYILYYKKGGNNGMV